ncbi:glycosyltransferase [Dehalobacterium formicoaceticum]|uniref:glycosyltransferase n=1 Tax=Dehalobacterium formicoaceticum TaxID=51515 RepID=UPI000B7D5D51|nr:glycosyltransferase [Dehalobacterium formicoaceticum]
MKSLVFVIGTMGNGGAERVIANLSNQFVHDDIKVSIITIYGTLQSYPLNDKVSLYHILCNSKIKVLRPLERMMKMRRIIGQISPDIVVSFLTDVNIHALITLIGKEVPIIVSERNDPTKSPNAKWMRMLRDALYKEASGVVYQTQDASNYFEKYVPDKIKQTIIANPIKDDLPFYVSRPAKVEFITACRLNKQKNLHLMINSVKRVIDSGYECFLNIYGEGPMRQELEAYIASVGLDERVSLCGFSDSIHEKMAKATAFIISSDFEGISNSMLEALGIGIPVIATDCPIGGARQYIINEVNGYLIPCRDVDSMSKAMIDVIKNPAKAIEMGKEATKIREMISTKKIVSQWTDFINKVIVK